MSNMSYLNMPTATFETSNCLAIGWFFLFDGEDLHYSLTGSPEGDDGAIPRGDDETMGYGTDLEAFGFRTTVSRASERLDRRISMTGSPYLKALVQELEPLKEALEEAGADEEVWMDCGEYVMLYDDLGEAVRELGGAPERLEEALRQDGWESFAELARTVGNPDLRMTGDIQEDAADLEDRVGYTLQEALIGFH